METYLNSLLRVTNLTKRFVDGSTPVVDRASFSVNPHEILAILGPSGCGKTTTLRLIAGFERVDQGSIQLKGKTLGCPYTHIAPEKRGIGFVFQDYALFPHLNVLKNVMFGLRHLERKTREKQAMDMLDLIGMKDYAHRFPHELSGGQQQRVALARALAPKPEIILLDEPFSNLDAVLRQSTRDEVRSILKKAGMSAILVTHDQEEALSIADRIAVMHEGQIVQVGTPEEVYYQPRTEFVANFLGKTNLFPASAAGLEASTQIGHLMLNRPATGDVVVSIRPEHLTLEKPFPGCAGTCGKVLTREFKGHDITYRIQLQNCHCLVHTDNRMPFVIGDEVIVKPLEPAVVLDDNHKKDSDPKNMS